MNTDSPNDFVMKRASYLCEACGKNPATEIHYKGRFQFE
jgi:hypothetical protein